MLAEMEQCIAAARSTGAAALTAQAAAAAAAATGGLAAMEERKACLLDTCQLWMSVLNCRLEGGPDERYGNYFRSP
jgi:hypothetical protein